MRHRNEEFIAEVGDREVGYVIVQNSLCLGRNVSKEIEYDSQCSILTVIVCGNLESIVHETERLEQESILCVGEIFKIFATSTNANGEAHRWC